MLKMKFFTIFLMFFPLSILAEEFNLICEGNRESRSFDERKINILEFESVLLKVKNESLEYIGINSGRRYLFTNKVYIAPKRPPHEDIEITERYELTSSAIKASQKISDIGNRADSSLSSIDLQINRLTGKLYETENIINKKTLKKYSTNNYQAFCKKDDRSF